MACLATKGRNVPCKDVVGGIARVYISDFGTISGLTLTNDEVTGCTASFTAFVYELKGGNSLEQAITSSPENGTTFFEQTLTLNLQKLYKEDHKELKLLAYGRPQIIVEDYNGNAFLCGREHGMSVSGGTIATGAAMGDMSGYTLTFSGQEVLPANFISGAVAGNPFADSSVFSGTVTTTAGTNS